MATRKTHCKYGHALADAYLGKDGSRSCRQCQARRSSKYYEGKRPADDVAIAAVTGASLKLQRIWATRRRHFGDSGMSARSLSHIRRIASRSAQKKRSKTHCRRGHKLSGANLYINPGTQYRQCRTCIALRWRQRPGFVQEGTVRISVVAHDAFYRREYHRLRDAMIAAHPDKHPGRKVSTGPFIRARQALKDFIATEREWYARYYLKVPTEDRKREAGREQPKAATKPKPSPADGEAA